MASGGFTLEGQFAVFSRFGDPRSDGKKIALSASDRWMKQAKVFDKKLTTTDTGVAFGKFKARAINYADFNKYLEDLANTKKIDLEELKEKLVNCGAPGLTSTQAAKATDAAATHKE